MQSLRIMGLCSLLTFCAAQANEQGQAIAGTVFKQVQGVAHGLPAGVARAAAHVFVTGPLTSKMYGANNSRLIRRVAAVIASLGLHLTVNGVIEKFRHNLTSKVEENMCHEEDNTAELTDTYAQLTDWTMYIVLMALYAMKSHELPDALDRNHDNGLFEALLRGFAESPEDIDWQAISDDAAQQGAVV